MKRRSWFRLIVLCALLVPALPGTSVQAQSPVLYVKPGGLESGPCDGWASACSLEYALGLVVGTQEIWVATGIHRPETAYTFQLKSGVAVYGGFAGTETSREERDWLENDTHLSGDLGTPGDPSDNSLHVVVGSLVDSTAILDGFWIEDGNATYSGTPSDEDPNLYNSGGGVYIQDGSPTILHVKIDGNHAFLRGGGLYNAGAGHPVLIDVTFSENQARDGGAIYNGAAGALSVSDAIISDHSAYDTGGGIYNAGTLELTDVVISNNSALRGGGIFNGLVAYLLGSRVTFKGNTADNGGGLHNEDGEVELAACTFSGNSADTGGGLANVSGSVQVMYSHFSGNGALGGGGLNSSGEGSITVIHGSTFDQNEAMEGGAIRNDGSGHMDIINSTISGNRASGSAGGIMTTSRDGTDLYNVTVTGNVLTALLAGGAGGLFNEDGTFRLHNSIIAGNETRSEVEQYPDCLTDAIESSTVAEYTLIGDTTGCDGIIVTGPGNLAGDSDNPLDPKLYRLADNGGPAPTHALSSDSPALDAGNPAGCTDHEDESLDTDQRGMERPRDGGTVSGPACDMGAYETGLSNDAWTRALHLDLAGDPLQATAEEYVDKLGQSRWYKFTVEPGSRVTVKLEPGAANYDLILYKDIAAAYKDLASPEDLVRLDAEFAPDMFSPDMFSPDMFSPDMFSPDMFSPDMFSPDMFSPDMFSPDMFSPDMFSPDMFSPDMFSPDMFSPDMFSPDMFSPDMFSPDMFSPEQAAFASAQLRSMVAVSAFDGTAGEMVQANTWDNSGDFYVRVRGRNGAFNLSAPFQLEVTQEVGICGGVSADLAGDRLAAEANDYQIIFLTDWSRLDDSTLREALEDFAESVQGVVVDVSQDGYVFNANTQADANLGCPFAKNIVARAIKDIVLAYEEVNPLQYVVLVGNDKVIPYFRHPDRALLAHESGYRPPVDRDTASHASLALGYVLSQDGYGSKVDLSLSNTVLPVPDLAVGRLVETPAEIRTMLRAYAETAGVVALQSALVTGYDFLEDAALGVQSELAIGLGLDGTVDSLITPNTIAPLDREGDPPKEAPWAADTLASQLDGSDYDLIFLAGHFSAGSALAADYETRLLASELLSSTAILTNAVVYSAGCHSGYNVVNDDGIPDLTPDPDWAQAFAHKGATFVGGTGYQYGDTDFVEYSERLYLEFTKQLCCGIPSNGDSGISVGQALVAAKQAYLAGTAQMRGIHEKSLLEATLYGLPMLQVGGLDGTGCLDDSPSEVEPVEYSTKPGSELDLYHATVTADGLLEERPKTLTDANGNPMTATYLEGPDGVVTNPAEPVLPLERFNVSVDNFVLRGVGFRSGSYTDRPEVAPRTGAATTEIRGVRMPFQSEVFYPVRPWRANYFDALAKPGSGATWLDVTRAQFMSTDPQPWYGTLRQFDDMVFRLFYSANTTAYGDNVPALAAPPAIVKVMATAEGGGVSFRATVLGDPTAGIQEVWVTYTTCDAAGACDGVWRSLDLQQKNPDTESTLWEEDLALIPNNIAAEEIRYMVQAVSGVGLVTLVTNQGEYYRVGVDPADPSAAGDPASPPSATTLSPVSLPGTGAYGTEVELGVELNNNAQPIDGQRVTFALGPVRRWATTGSDGVATIKMPLLAPPGTYDLRVSFAGTAEYLPSSITSDFDITQQSTTLSLHPGLDPVQYSDDPGLVARLADVDLRPLREKTVLLVVNNGVNSYGTAAITNLVSEASLGPVPLPSGSYGVTAHFGDLVSLPDGTVDLSDDYYGPSQASATLEVQPENATVTYTGDTLVPEDATMLNLSATISQEEDGSPGDIRLASVRYDVWHQGSDWAGSIDGDVDKDGTSTAIIDGLSAGSYYVDVTVVGGFFASSPAPQVAGLDLPMEPVPVNGAIDGFAYFTDADTPFAHHAVWDWGDGSQCDTSSSSECTLIEPSGTTPGQVTGQHIYEQPGVYTVKLMVLDGDGHADESVFEFVVVYSLEGGTGFVTGGGWISSSPGAYALEPMLTGKANFGFVSKYLKGATKPTGNTEFQFKTASLNFHSDSYQWLAVNQAGTNAQFKGTGTINGSLDPNGEQFKFMIWATDGDPEGTDAFRIKIWYEDGDGEAVVYDNGFDQPIGGGDIVVHPAG